MRSGWVSERGKGTQEGKGVRGCRGCGCAGWGGVGEGKDVLKARGSGVMQGMQRTRSEGGQGFEKGRACRGSVRGSGFSGARSAGEPVSGRSRSGEGCRSARMGAGAVPGSEGLLTDTPGVEAARRGCREHMGAGPAGGGRPKATLPRSRRGGDASAPRRAGPGPSPARPVLCSARSIPREAAHSAASPPPSPPPPPRAGPAALGAVAGPRTGPGARGRAAAAERRTGERGRVPQPSGAGRWSRLPEPALDCDGGVSGPGAGAVRGWRGALRRRRVGRLSAGCKGW